MNQKRSDTHIEKNCNEQLKVIFDNSLDLIVSNSVDSYDISVLVNKGNGTFFPETRLSVRIATSNLPSLVDYNNDGYLDLITTTNEDRGLVAVLLNNRNGSFKEPLWMTTGYIDTYPVEGVAAVDINNDTYIDVVTCEIENDLVFIFENTLK